MSTLSPSPEELEALYLIMTKKSNKELRDVLISDCKSCRGKDEKKAALEELLTREFIRGQFCMNPTK